MFKKIYIILCNFFKTSTKSELFEIIILPIIVTVLIYIFSRNLIIEINEFVNDFNNTAISVTALLVAFGVASLSILVTSSNANIEDAKKNYTKRIDMRNMNVSYYKLQIIRSFFNIFLQLIILLITISLKFIYSLSINIVFTQILLYFESALLLISIFSQTFVVMSIYYLFVEPKNVN